MNTRVQDFLRCTGLELSARFCPKSMTDDPEGDYWLFELTDPIRPGRHISRLDYVDGGPYSPTFEVLLEALLKEWENS